MNDQKKTKDQLIMKLEEMRRFVADLEQSQIEFEQVEKTIQNRFDLEKLANQISISFVNADGAEIDSAITSALEKIAHFAGANRSSLFLLSDNMEVLTNTHEWCMDSDDSQIALLQDIPFSTFGYYQKLLLQFETIAISKLTELPSDAKGEWKWIREHGFRSLLFIPLIKQSRLMGALGFYGEIKKEINWSSDLIDMLKSVGNLILNTLERKRVMSTLQESEEQYRLLYENIPVGVGVADQDGNLLSFNEILLTPGGYAPEDIAEIGQVDQLYADPLQREEVLGLLQKQGFVDSHEVEFKRKDGTIYNALMSLTPIQINDKRCIQAVVEDITLRKMAEDALRESEEYLSSLMESITDAVFIVRMPERRIEYVNPSISDIFGYSPEEVIGHTTRMLYKEEVDFLTFAEKIQTVMDKGFSVYRGEEKLLRKDGSLFWGELATRFHSANGELDRVISVVHDVTERKRAEVKLQESEERFRSIFETTPVSIWQEDFSAAKAAMDELKADGVGDLREYFYENPAFLQKCADLIKVLDVNEKTIMMFNAQSKEEMLGSLEKVFTEETPEILIEELLALAEGKGYFEGETVNKTLDGKRKNILMTMAFPSENERLDSVLVNMMDITERVQAEEKNTHTLALSDATLESTDNGILVIDNFRKVVKSNNEFAKLWRIPKDILDRGSDDELLDFVLDQLSNPEQFINKVQELYDNPELESFDVLDFKDGRIFERFSRPMLIDGKPSARVWSFRDVTEKEKAKQELQQAHDTLEDRVRERTKELEKMLSLMAGREVRMAELKKVIKKLRKQLGEAGMEPVAEDPLIPAEDGY
ncbi:MAG: PAS domain S-box protein [Anaerolineales bacterium]|nr:PAS domain S-box protein [Anaerolineales bacterium]